MPVLDVNMMRNVLSVVKQFDLFVRLEAHGAGAHQAVPSCGEQARRRRRGGERARFEVAGSVAPILEADSDSVEVDAKQRRVDVLPGLYQLFRRRAPFQNTSS